MELMRAIVLLLLMAVPAQAQQLAPFKDALFAYPSIVEREASGDILVDYIRDRDLVGRDLIPKRKVKFDYIDESVRWKRRVRDYTSPNGTKKHFQVGRTGGNAAVTVIYVHGKGGNRRQGVNDYTFGGNFNRLQNLMARNNGLLLTPDFAGFGKAGVTDIEALAVTARITSPRGKLIIACGSMGGSICWDLASRPATSKLLDGILLLGSFPSPTFLASDTMRRDTHDVPILIAHGTLDQVFPYAKAKAYVASVRAKRVDYPIRMVGFRTGVHGTPIRMVDWRLELNRMLALP